jgi:ATP-dependent Clp protease ATP-binding subunit ClpC
MFERYNEQARRVLFFSRYEASQFGNRSIETEHVLLGLIRDGKGIAVRVFEAAHLAVEDVRHEIVRRKPPTDERVATSVEIPFSAETKRVLQFAAEEADSLKHHHIGAEHLLLGLLREYKSLAASVLAERGLRLSDARTQVAELLARSPFVADSADAPAGTTRRLVVVKTELKEQDLVEVAAQIDGIKTCVEQLGRTPNDSSEARALVIRIREDLDALKRRLGL